MAFELGPDGLTFNTPATATWTAPLEESGLLGGDGSVELFEVLLTSDGGEPETLAVTVEIGEDVVAMAEVAHFSRLEFSRQGLRARQIVLPTDDPDFKSFTVPTGGVVTTALELTATGEFEGTIRILERADDITELDAALNGESTYVNFTGARAFAPRRYRCDDVGPATLTRILYVYGPLGEEIIEIAVLQLPGTCSDPDGIVTGATPGKVVGAGLDETFLVSDGSTVVRVNGDGEGIGQISTRRADRAVEVVPGRFILQDGNTLVLVGPDGDDIYFRTGDYSDVSFQQVGPLTWVFIGRSKETDQFEVTRAVYTEAGAIKVTVLGDFKYGSEARRVAAREGQRQGTVGLQELECGQAGACIEVNEDTVKGALWSDPSSEPLLEGNYDSKVAITGPPIEQGNLTIFPTLGEDGTFAAFARVNGVFIQFGGTDAECEDPSGLACLPDGRCARSCGDTVELLPALPDVDLDDLVDCQDDLWEDWDPNPGITLAATDTVHQLGQNDEQDVFRRTVSVPEECVNPRLAGSYRELDTGEVSDFTLGLEHTADGQTWEPVAMPLDEGGYFNIPLVAGTTETVTLRATSNHELSDGCAEYALAASLECDEAPDDFEDNDAIEDAHEFSVDLPTIEGSIDPDDPDYFRVTDGAECDVELVPTWPRDDLEVPGMSVEKVADDTWLVESEYASSDYTLTIDADCPIECDADGWGGDYERDDAFSPDGTVFIGEETGVSLIAGPDQTRWFQALWQGYCYGPGTLDLTVTVQSADPDATLTMIAWDEGGSTETPDDDVLLASQDVTNGATLSIEDAFSVRTDGVYVVPNMDIGFTGEGGCVEATWTATFSCP